MPKDPQQDLLSFQLRLRLPTLAEGMIMLALLVQVSHMI